MKKGIIVVISYGIILLTAFFFHEPLINWLNRSEPSQLPLMFCLAVFFGIIPVVPFSVFGALMGAKYGIWMGAAINWFGSIGASAILFFFARFVFIKEFQQLITRFNKIKKFDELISHNAFIAVLFSRMIPIIPPPVVNIYSGLSTMLFKTYILATAIGQIPGMIVYAFIGNQLFESIQHLMMGIGIYLGFLIIIIPFYRWWRTC
ncbi:TVP38/TMEM64 family protein [Gracilibacillus salitolerans]|uniref:TVP38/TMEM64 family membrane protein n=1 Tax=Gracilibacillus salitolerans TaxID=2663022 RepID=A0A5Q2TLA5_9BACI|nr:TVP38/TMEM64 family protein [Gracilibacillus salitolerans]QGH34753.1 TVP38/TMEM64 family protein [Gracilibacillus salitolerans]